MRQQSPLQPAMNSHINKYQVQKPICETRRTAECYLIPAHSLTETQYVNFVIQFTSLNSARIHGPSKSYLINGQ